MHAGEAVNGGRVVKALNDFSVSADADRSVDTTVRIDPLHRQQVALKVSQFATTFEKMSFMKIIDVQSFDGSIRRARPRV